MILVVDDDDRALEEIRAVLEAAGYQVSAHRSAAEALAACCAEPPELIVSDVMMPEMDGVVFRKEVARRFPDASPPFVFLSSMGDPGSIVRGLDSGGDDYLVKPVADEVLLAKIRALSRARCRPALAAFHGSLHQMSFPDLLKFCELKSLTGFVRVEAGDLHVDVHFHSGAIDAATVEEYLDRLCELNDGAFTIFAQPVDFSEIARPEPRAPVPAPAGRLSLIRLGGRVLQLQTEYLHGPRPAVVTLVTASGRTLWKTSVAANLSQGSDGIGRQVDSEHLRVSNELQQKIEELKDKLQPRDESTRQRFHELFDEGYDSFRNHDYQGALRLWREALELDPTSKLLEVNLRIAQGKVAETSHE